MVYLASFDNVSHNPWIDVMCDRIIKHFAPLKIILFGSYARGEVTPHSDIDLLIVFPTVDNKRQKTLDILALLSDLPIPKDIVLTTPEEIEAYGHLVGTILRPALCEGKVLYECPQS